MSTEGQQGQHALSMLVRIHARTPHKHVSTTLSVSELAFL